MLTRILTAVVLMPILVVIHVGPAWLFLGLATAAGIAVTWEAMGLHEARGVAPLKTAAVTGVVLLNVAFFDPGHLPPVAALALGAVLVVGARLLLRRGVEDALESISASLACLLAPGLLLAFQVALRRLEAQPEGPAPALLLYLYAAVFGHDAGAYFVGRFLGRTPLAPSVSPNKTVEGLLGGLLVGVVLGLALGRFLLPGLSPGRAALLAGLLAMAAALGDLTVSLWKRSAGVKDAGRILPGHGGFLDRLAGLLWASPLLYLVLTASHRHDVARAVREIASCAA